MVPSFISGFVFFVRDLKIFSFSCLNFLLHEYGIYDKMKHIRREGLRYEKTYIRIGWIAGIARIC